MLISITLAALLAAAPAHAAALPQPLSLPTDLPIELMDGERSARALALQVLLDRARHAPGVIDGVLGGNTRRAVRAYQAANGLPGTGEADDAMLARLAQEVGPAILRTHRLTAEDVAGPFVDVPEGFTAQAELEQLAFEEVAEQLGERFHMAPTLLRALNPQARFAEGEEIRVVAHGEDALEAKVARIEVSKSRSEVRALSADGALVASYPATVGSDDFPSPDGSMSVRAIAPAPKYYFDPTGREWGPDERLTIAAGPNNPVGGTWIDLTKEGYGIHGTPDPSLIGKTASHGCVRLTNWDAAELASGVETGAEVVFTG